MHPIRSLAVCAATLAIGLHATVTPSSAAPATDPGVAWASRSAGIARQTMLDHLAVSAPVVDTPSTCRGVPATAIVDPDEDFVGTDADEVIVVLGSNASVQASGGNDTICVHGNHAAAEELSTIDAGAGDDVVLGVSGSLLAYGEDGNDVLLGNGKYMWFYGGEGHDTLNAAGATWSTMDGGGWNDRITGSPGIDLIVGGDGDDGIWGWDGPDTIDGGIGNDRIDGGDSFDTLDGGGGTNHCYDVESPVHGADISNCIIHLTPHAPDEIVLG
jgi:hypothetical protein